MVCGFVGSDLEYFTRPILSLPGEYGAAETVFDRGTDKRRSKPPRPHQIDAGKDVWLAANRFSVSHGHAKETQVCP